MVRSVSVILAILLPAACHHADPDGPPAPADAPRAEVTLLVRNHHWLDINVYLVRGNIRQRLGTVTGTADKRFSIPWSRLDGQTGLQLIADPVGQTGQLRSDLVAIRPGSDVEWTIENGMRSSTMTVF